MTHVFKFAHKSVTQSQCIAWKCCHGLARQAFCWCLLVVLHVRVTFDWICYPFDIEMSDLAGCELEELAELSCDRTLKIQFRKKSLSAFWLNVSTEYPLLSDKAVNILLPFATTYLCETAFSALTNLYEDEVQIQSCRWKWHACMFIQHYAKNWQSVQSEASTSITLTLFAFRSIHCNLYIIDDVGLFVKSSVLKNFSILQ